jgi:siroheme synthase-like protein
MKAVTGGIQDANPLFPVFLKLTGRLVLVVGGGSVAAGKVEQLLAAGAEVLLVAPWIDPRIRNTAAVLRERGFQASDLDGVWLVVAAATPEVNAAVVAAAQPRQLFVNAVDDRERASAYLGGVLRRGGITIAASTEGAAPALAGLLREALSALLPEEPERWIEIARQQREGWHANGVPHAHRRPLLLAALNRLYAGQEAVGR